MKKTIYNIFSLAFMAAALFAGVSCEDENPLDNGGGANSPGQASNFPELIENHDVEPGQTLTFTIQPNAAWSISINKESYAWFKIKDGKFDKQTLSGVSLSEPKEITIWTTSEESFDLRSCEVTMKVKGESKVIAKYTLRTKAKAIEAYKAAVTEDGAFSYAEGGYVYEQMPMTSGDEIELVWNENEKKFYFPVKISANYDWAVEWPSWARADIDVDSKIGDTSLEIYGIPSQLPLEDAEGEVSFKDGETVLKTFKVKIPGCRDIFSYNIGGSTSLTFDHAQYFHSGEGSFSKDPVQGQMFGPSGARILVLEMTNDGYVVPETPWLDVALTAWDSVEGADVLQTRNISISAPIYAGRSDRNALILFLPATAPTSIDELLADKKNVKEEYASYAVSVVQTGCPDEYFTFEAEETERVSAGLLFEKSGSDILPDKNFSYAEGAEGWQYNLSYTKDMAVAKSPFYITFPYETIAIYDAEGNEVTENLSEHWLSYNPLGEGLYGQILMDMTKITADEKPTEIDGFVVFKNEQGKVLAVVHCFYKAEEKTAEDVLEDASATMFADPAAASAAGATIHQVISGPTYEKYKEQQAPVYVLRYTKDNTTLKINTSKTCQLYTCVGKPNGPEMVTIDDQIFTDTEFAEKVEQYLAEGRGSEINWDDDRSTMGYLRFGATSQITRSYQGVSDFNMTMPEPEDGSQKATTYEEVVQFATTEAIQFIFICELDLSSSSQN